VAIILPLHHLSPAMRRLTRLLWAIHLAMVALRSLVLLVKVTHLQQDPHQVDLRSLVLQVKVTCLQQDRHQVGLHSLAPPPLITMTVITLRILRHRPSLEQRLRSRADLVTMDLLRGVLGLLLGRHLWDSLTPTLVDLECLLADHHSQAMIHTTIAIIRMHLSSLVDHRIRNLAANIPIDTRVDDT